MNLTVNPRTHRLTAAKLKNKFGNKNAAFMFVVFANIDFAPFVFFLIQSASFLSLRHFETLCFCPRFSSPRFFWASSFLPLCLQLGFFCILFSFLFPERLNMKDSLHATRWEFLEQLQFLHHVLKFLLCFPSLLQLLHPQIQHHIPLPQLFLWSSPYSLSLFQPLPDHA
uniref:Transmembrane protein n=1 Tax=Nelumbo nucifera TaxID=4432 RepID=A0A822ZBE8_NELNU|nr:TPA_asm: hypothetical protein HUJ06_013190 [Nelumbo nucifera]